MKARPANPIEDYDFGRALGEGTFGKVRIAFSKPTKECVAVKILHKSRIVSPAEVQSVTREIAILKALNHPYVVHLYEIIETKEELYLIMDFADSGDLQELVQQKDKLDEAEAAPLFAQIVQGLEYLHSMGFAHRDLKPSNILLTRNSRQQQNGPAPTRQEPRKPLSVTIADFGLSNMYKPAGRLNSACGSPCYAAPQVIQNKTYEPAAADIWSLGVTLFVMLLGYLPFYHKNTQTLYKLIISGKLDIPSGVSKQAADLILSMIQVDPKKRAKFKDLRTHPWLKAHNIQLGDFKHPEPPIVNQLLLDAVEIVLGSKIDRADVANQIRKHRHTKITTIYHLLAKKSKQELMAFVPNLRQKTLQTPKVVSLKVESTGNIKLDLDSSIEPNSRRMFRRTPKNDNPISCRRPSSKDVESPMMGVYLKFFSHKSSNVAASTDSIENMNKITLKFANKSNQYMPLSQQHKESSVSMQRKSDLHSTKHQVLSVSNRNRSKSRERCVSIESKGGSTRRLSFVQKSHQVDEYNGPYNIDCVFEMQPIQLKIRLMAFLRQQGVAYKQVDRWGLDIKQKGSVVINRLAHLEGMSVVRFFQMDTNEPLVQTILEHLSTSL